MKTAEEEFEKFRDFVLSESKKGNVVINSIEGIMTLKLTLKLICIKLDDIVQTVVEANIAQAMNKSSNPVKEENPENNPFILSGDELKRTELKRKQS
jgi:hypothetical protein